jgi:FkbM family methyltransferase
MKFVKNTWLPATDIHFENIMDNEGNYQKKQFDAVIKYIEPENRGLFIDVGAHVGLWSRMAIKAGFKQIIAFEPNKDNRECFKLNIPKDDSLICPFGLSDKKEYMHFEFGKNDNSGSNAITSNGKIRLWKFDELMLDQYLNQPILVKIDVQGYEYKVVKGMTNFIKDYKPIIIVEQFLDGKEDLQATEYCQSLGMKILKKVNKEVILGW